MTARPAQQVARQCGIHGMMLRESKNRGNLNWKQVLELAQGPVGTDSEGYAAVRRGA